MPEAATTVDETKNKTLFKYLIVIEPLGFLYGSAGRFLSPENLVGRSGTSFPPSAASLSGVFAAYFAQQEPDKDKLKQLLAPLQLAGPFWADNQEPQNFYVPTPFNCLVKKGEKSISDQLKWNGDRWINQNQKNSVGKFESDTWIAIQNWKQLDSINWTQPPEVKEPEWKSLPHLHPQLETEQRRVNVDLERGSLFLENAIQLDPDTCLIYLSNTKIDPGWYRFGGEGHLVDLKCLEISQFVQELLNKEVGKSFALITPAVWGSNRLSTRFPVWLQCDHPQQQAWEDEALLTERPDPYRYRLGGDKDKAKRLSRGRYAVPAGTVYVLKKPQSCWQEWHKNWFPYEGYSFKRWGCGLALPLNIDSPQKLEDN